MADDGVDIYWIPLGAGTGGELVRWSGRAYEAAAAAVHRRPRCDLYHSALEVTADGTTAAIEMAPAWAKRGERGVVGEGPVGARFLGRSRLFRYEIRCWRGGAIPDLDAAVGGGRRVSGDPATAAAVLDLVARCPVWTWGRDELKTGDMWNSNSLISWVLTRAGVPIDEVGPPPGGRAPGWEAGLVAAGLP